MAEGWNWKAPWEGTRKVNTQVQSYETSGNPDTSKADFTDYEIEAQTSDGQQISVSYTVIFRIEPQNAIDVLRNVGDVDQVVENVVKAASRSLARIDAQGFPAQDLYSGTGIQEYESTVQKALAANFATYQVTLVDFLVRKVSFDPDYVQAIEAKQIADENIRTQEFNAQAAKFERDRNIALAEADARKNVLLADADAQRITLLAEANAKAISLQGEALHQYPEMVQYALIQQLNNVQWGILPEGVLPLLNLQTPGAP